MSRNLLSIRVAAVLLLIAGTRAEATGLQIDDGVVVKFGADAGLVVRSGIQVGEGVVFTTLADDSVAGQTLPTAGTPARGQWQGLQVLPSVAEPFGSPLLRRVQIRYAGQNGAAALELARFDYGLEGLIIRDSSLGLRTLDGSTATLAESWFSGNEVALLADRNAAPGVTVSAFNGNSLFGANNLDPTTPIVARGNWWGASSGPTDPVGNPGGTGDKVSSGVDYAQFSNRGLLAGCQVRVRDGRFERRDSTVPFQLWCANAVSYRAAPTGNFASNQPFVPMVGQVDYSLAALEPDQNYPFRFEFKDSAGTVRAFSFTPTIRHAPPPETQPPGISSVLYGGTALSNGRTLTAPALLTAQITDQSFPVTVTLTADGVSIFQLVASHAGQLAPLSTLLSFATVDNGARTLVLSAVDRHGNSATATYAITLGITPPPAPVILSPLNNSAVSAARVDVSGTAQPGSTVQLLLDGQNFGATGTASNSGSFGFSRTLPAEGSYQFSAVATNSRGSGPASSNVRVTYSAAAPSVVFTAPVQNATLEQPLDVSFSVNDSLPITEAKLFLDGSEVASFNAPPYRWAWNVPQSSDGSHTLLARVKNAANKLTQVTRLVFVAHGPPPPPPFVAPYIGEILSVSPASSFGEQPVVITGQVKSTGPNPQVLGTAALKLVLSVSGGFQRTINVATDPAGQFSFSFQPQPTDAGVYTVSAVHPDETNYPNQGSFTLSRLTATPAVMEVRAARNFAQTLAVQLRASVGAGSNGVQVLAVPGDQPSGSLPNGISIAPSTPTNIAAGAQASVSVRFTGDSTAAASGVVFLRVQANESGNIKRSSVRLNYTLSNPLPFLKIAPAPLQTGLSPGQVLTESLTLSNDGLIPATAVEARLVASGASQVPAWASLNASDQGQPLAIGASRTLDILLQPGTKVPDGVYNFAVRVTSSNATAGDAQIAVAITQNGEGNAQFKVENIFTGANDEGGNTIQGLAGAKIRLIHETVPGIERTITSNAVGVASATGLVPGRYTWRASAARHSDTSGRIQIRAGASTSEKVFLDMELVTFEWSVTETTIIDRYDVTLQATFQTEVPAPVVLIEPGVINVPDGQVGEVHNGELTITNYGLIRADGVVFTPPASDQYYKYEFLGTVPNELAARQRISMPYRVTKLGNIPGRIPGQVTTVFFEQLSDGRASNRQVQGATCGVYTVNVGLRYTYACINGDIRSGSSSASYTQVYGFGCGGGGGISYIGGGGGGGGGWGPGGGGPGGNYLLPSCAPDCNGFLCKPDGGDPPSPPPPPGDDDSPDDDDPPDDPPDDDECND